MILPDPQENVLSLAAAVEWRNGLRRAGRTLVVTNGCFDLMHRGHASYLRQAAALGEEKLDELVRVGVLRVMRDTPATPATGMSKESVTEQDSEPTAADDHEEDLPVLEAADDIISDVKSAKRAKRAKRKEETA